MKMEKLEAEYTSASLSTSISSLKKSNKENRNLIFSIGKHDQISQQFELWIDISNPSIKFVILMG
jgi:hypothetical protein